MDGGAGEHRGQLRRLQVAVEADLLVDSESCGESLQLAVERVEPGDVEGRVGVRAENPDDCVQQHVLVLHPVEVADVDEAVDDRRPIRVAEDGGVGAQRNDFGYASTVLDDVLRHPRGRDGDGRGRPCRGAGHRPRAATQAASVPDVGDRHELAAAHRHDGRHPMPQCRHCGSQTGQVGPQPVDHVGSSTFTGDAADLRTTRATSDLL